MTVMPVKLSWAPERGDERVTHTLSARQIWRQVGWIGQTGQVYAMDGDVSAEPGGFTALWILVEDDLPGDLDTEDPS